MTIAPEATPAEPIQPSEAPPEQSTATVLDALDEWLSSLRIALARAADIAVLEARLATLNFTLILIVAVASGLLLATAWIALFAAAVAWLHELGLSWSTALLSMAALNLALAVAGGYAIYRMSNNLLFTAIRKFIKQAPQDTNGERNAAAESTVRDTPPAP